MSGLAFLVTELQSLASETRRKYPDVRDAADKSLSILRASPEQASASLLTDGAQSEDLLRPIFMGCATKNPKVVTISLGSLQRLIVMKAVPLSSIPHIVSTIADCMSQGVDVQLRILQTLLSLLTNYSGIHGTLLRDALLLCFRLQESRITVVSSTAAATLRQLVMLVFDKVVVDSERLDQTDEEAEKEEKIVLPNGTEVDLHPSSRDAFRVFQDLCLLANSEPPTFLSLESLPKTFALELIESVLANYHLMFRKRSELLLVLRHHLSPLLLKTFSDKPIFPLTLRSTRVVFLLLKQFLDLLETEAEVFLMLFTKVISGDHDSHEAPRPLWMRVLAMEITRGLCSDAEIVRQIWDRYDGARMNSSSKVFSTLITALKRLATEKPALLGASSQIYGLGVPSTATSQPTLDLGLSGASGYGIETVAGVVVSAANMVGIGSGGGLSVQGAAMKLQCIDQLDKADPPAIPELYIFLLALQSIVALTEAFASLTIPLYTSIAIQRPRAAGDAPIRAPPALNVSTLPDSEASTRQLRSVYGMMEMAWPATLAALSFFIATNLSDDLFVEVLTGLQSMANVAGVVGLSTPRDAFLTCLSKFAIPSGVVSALDSTTSPETPMSPRSAGVLSAASENLGLTALANSVGGGGTAVNAGPSLSDRNMACLKVLISTALFLAGSLGSSWFDVLETLQNAEYVLFVKGPSAARRTSTGPSGLSPVKSRVTSSGGAPGTASNVVSPSSHSRSSLMSDLDVESVRAMMNRLFDASKGLDDEAFRSFIAALCKLSSEMINMQSGLGNMEDQREESVDDLSPTPDTGLLSPRVESPHRRRASGIQLTRNIRGGDFGIARLGSVSKLNIHRLIYRDPGLAWNPVVGHLLSTLRNAFAPAPIRLQSAEVLDDLLVVVPRNITNSGDHQTDMQQRMFDALSEQVIFEPPQFSSTVTEVRRLGLECLHEILQFSAHTLVTGWETIFKILSSACVPSSNSPSLSPRSRSDQSEASARPRLFLPSPLFKPNISLLRIAFQSLTLVCDSIDTLSPDNLRLCVTTLGQFGTQPDTNMALTAAESLMWGVSDSIQSKRKDSEKEPIYSNLWMFLLSELLRLCADHRTEVRNGSIQTLFRSLQLYGATLSPEMWTECLDTIIFALFDSLSSSIGKLHAESVASSNVVAPTSTPKEWFDTKSLAFQLVGSVFSEFLVSHIIRLASFTDIWQRFVTHVTQAALSDDRSVATAALRSLESSISASRTEEPDLEEISRAARETAWSSLEAVGSAVANRRGTSEALPTEVGAALPPFSQASLLALADVIRILYVFNGDQWELGRLRQMMFILKGIMTYTKSPEYRPDVDKLTPVQSAVVQAVEAIKLTVRFSPSLLLSDLSEFATLAFVAAFDVEDISDTPPSTAAKQVTYIALAKYAMPKLVELYLSHKTQLDIYNDGTLARVLSSYSTPMKLKYDCPSPSKLGSDEPLWKTASTNFLKIVRELGQSIKSFGDDILPEHIEGIWRQALDVFRGALLADCFAATQFPLEKQDSEEKFDLALLATLEIDVIPYIGDPRVPNPVITQLGKTLQNASVFHDLESHLEARINPPSQMPLDKAGKNGKVNDLTADSAPVFGTTAPANLLPRERFKYWCFDLLFLTCSASTQDNATERQRIAALILPSLLSRCHTVLATYVVDEALRGGVPFPRVREEELLYVLRKLQELRLWYGCLWASFSDDPSKYSIILPDIDTTLEPQKMIADATKRSTQGHLFHFYTLLYEIATIHRAPPSMWANSTSPPHPPSSDPSRKLSKMNGSKKKDKDKNKNKSHSPTESIHNRRGIIGAEIDVEPDSPGTVIEVDARVLAKDCLRQIGREMGAEI